LLFLYSRKPQILLLFCWSVALAGLFVYSTGHETLFFPHATEPPGQAKARLGELPPPPESPSLPDVQPAVPPPGSHEPPPVSEPAHSAHPARSSVSTINQGTDFRVFPDADGDEKKLVLEFDYIPAGENGFTLDKAHNFYTEDTPTVVIALGSPWELDVSRKNHSLAMKQATRASLWMTEARQLRMVTHTRTFAEAAGAKVRLTRTQSGLRAEIHFPR
jgi:hypothetical protein